MDKLLARLCETHDQATSHHNPQDGAVPAHSPTCSSLPVTPAVDPFAGTAPTTRPASAAPIDRAASEELLRLKLELAKAQSHISKVEHELAQTRCDQQDSDRSTPVPSSDSEFAGNGSAPLTVEPIGTKALINPTQSDYSRTQGPRGNAWQAPMADDCRSDVSDSVSANGFKRYRGIWNNGSKPAGYQNTFMPPPMPMQDAGPAASWSYHRNHGFMDQNMTPYSGLPVDGGFRGDRYSHEPDLMRPGSGRRGNRYDNRFNIQSLGAGFGGFNMGGIGQNQHDSAANYAGIGPGITPGGGGMAMFPQYASQAVGTPLSPHATEFTSAAASSWKPDVSSLRLCCSHAGVAVSLMATHHCLACRL